MLHEKKTALELYVYRIGRFLGYIRNFLDSINSIRTCVATHIFYIVFDNIIYSSTYNRFTKWIIVEEKKRFHYFLACIVLLNTVI